MIVLLVNGIFFTYFVYLKLFLDILYCLKVSYY